MARQSREEWFAGLKPGDAASATLPDDNGPSVGTVESVSSDGVTVRFAGREIPMHFGPSGALLGDPGCLLWMVSTGSGNIVIPAPDAAEVLG